MRNHRCVSRQASGMMENSLVEETGQNWTVESTQEEDIKGGDGLVGSSLCWTPGWSVSTDC